MSRNLNAVRAAVHLLAFGLACAAAAISLAGCSSADHANPPGVAPARTAQQLQDPREPRPGVGKGK